MASSSSDEYDETHVDNTSGCDPNTPAPSHSTLDPDVDLKWPNINYQIISRLCNCLSLSDRDCDMLIEEIKNLNVSMSIPVNVRDLRKAEQDAIEDASFNISNVPIPPPRTKAGHLMVEESSLVLIHQNILDAMQKLINIPEHAPWVVWHYDPQCTSDGLSQDPFGTTPLYSELNTAQWWETQQRSLPGTSPSLLVCILSCDETPTTMTGRKVCPVYATCGNIPRWYRQKSSGLLLLGFLPIVRPIKAYKNSVQVRSYRRQVKRWCMGVLLKPLMDHRNGINMRCIKQDGTEEWRWVYPRFPFLIADEPEVMHAVVGGYGSTQSRMPCSHCDVVPKSQGLRTCGRPRDIDALREHMCPVTQTSTISKEMSKKLSMHREFSWMPFVPGLNPYFNPADRMHQFDHGIFIMVKELVVEYIKVSYNAGSLQLFDQRWASLAKLPGLKIFKRGVSSLAFVPCFENRIMAMGLPFVLRGMGNRKLSTANDAIPKRGLEDLCITYLCARWLVAEDLFTPSKLDALSMMCDSLQDKIDALHSVLHGSPVDKGIKFHKLVHWVHYITAFGCSGNWNTESFESAHKQLKRWKGSLCYRSGASAGLRLMRQNSVRDGHTDAHAPSSNSIPVKKGRGLGGFKGRLDLGLSRCLTDSQLASLQRFERLPTFGQLAVEELYDEYARRLPDHCRDIAMLSTIINTNTTCMDRTDSPPLTMGLSSQDTDNYQFSFFWPQSKNRLLFWKKMYCTINEMYVSLDRDVRYTLVPTRGPTTEHIGRVRWIFSLPNLSQFVIIQRMHVLSTHDAGEGLTTHLMSICSETTIGCDNIKKHCPYMRLREKHLVNSYHLLALEEGGSSIDGIVMLQPDFEKCPTHEEDKEYQYNFLMPYTIQ